MLDKAGTGPAFVDLARADEDQVVWRVVGVEEEGLRVGGHQHLAFVLVALEDGSKRLIIETFEGNGSQGNYISGFEIMVKEWSELDQVLARTKGLVEMKLMPNGEVLKATSIVDNEPGNMLISYTAPYNCKLQEGLLAVIARRYGYENALVSHPECRRKGAPACLYRISYTQPEPT